MNKKILSLVILYLLQFMAASCDTCGCESASIFERQYTGVDLNTLDTSSSQTAEIVGTVNKSTFGITVLLQFELNQITWNKTRSTLSNFGFAAAYGCSCPENEYLDTDPINAIEIIATNTENEEETVVTDSFTVTGNDGEPMDIKAFFDIGDNWEDSFQLNLTTSDAIPDSSIFTVSIVLFSGNELSQRTEVIRFE